MGTRPLEAQIAGIAALGEPVRRALYQWVVARGGAVSRDQAAAGTGVSRALAAFHLDRLVQAGLLAASYRRLTGRTGPGAGRPAKLYSRSSEQVDVTLPPRSYALAAELFAEVLEAGGTTRGTKGGARALRQVALAFGRRLARDARGGAKGPRSRPKGAPALLAALEALGYEPVRGTSGEVSLRNCPFHALTGDHRSLVCGANLALLGGFVAELDDGRRDLRAVLEPRPGMCCVVLRPVARSAARRAPRRADHRR